MIASQCECEEELTELGKIAASLRDTLLDPDIGCCMAGLPNGEALLADRLPAAEIVAKTGEAIEYAAGEDATLLLAFLGHGFIPGTDPTLYFMGWNSVVGDRNSGVDIRSLLLRAADTPGIRGVTGIIDTCTAAAAIPGISGLTVGTLSGQTRITLVMACAVGQSAFDMGLSRQMVRLLRSGIPGAGPHLWLSAPQTRAVLRAALPGQPPVFHDYDGAATQPTDLWLARNAQAESVTLGSYGLAELTEVLVPLLPARQWTASPDAAALRELRRELAALPASPGRIRAERVLDGLHAAHATVVFLRAHMPERLGVGALRRALISAGSSAGPPVDGDTLARISSDVDAVECAALSYPRAQRSGRPQLARFVVELADDAGVDLDAPALREWAIGIDAIAPFNDAVEYRRRWRAERRLRLIVSLHYAPAGDWPASLGVWLLYDGAFYRSTEIGCTPDQRGAEKALTKAVDWAEELADEFGITLRRLEVAVPVAILLRWRPEDVRYVRRLGLDYEVLTRWSKRLEAGTQMRRVNKNAEHQLADIAGKPDRHRLAWLTARQVADLTALLAQLVDGWHAPAIGLVDDPGDNERLFETLLEFAPILIWPRARQLGAEHKEMVSAYWHLLPAGFTDAYRAQRADETGRAGGPLADMRAIWDNEEWLSFCKDLRVQPSGTEE